MVASPSGLSSTKKVKPLFYSRIYELKCWRQCVKYHKSRNTKHIKIEITLWMNEPMAQARGKWWKQLCCGESWLPCSFSSSSAPVYVPQSNVRLIDVVVVDVDDVIDIDVVVDIKCQTKSMFQTGSSWCAKCSNTKEGTSRELTR